MPELPEVETVRAGLEPAFAGSTIVTVEQRRADLRFPLPKGFAERLAGREVEGLGRRAKYLTVRLSGGEVLVMHLGMSGRFTIAMPDAATGSPGSFVHSTGGDPAHDHIVFHLSNGATVTYNDPRRFGFMDLVAQSEFESHKLFAALGPEPLGNSFNDSHLAERAQGKRTPLKSFLLDQSVVAGLGNIYVSEALYRAGLSPRRKAGCLALRSSKPTERCTRLVAAIRAVLTEAIAAGGSTLRDYRHADGALGYFQHAFRVYGREGGACLTSGCQGIVQRSVQAGRSTFHCPACQR
ncbi:MAG: hypothetical protein RLZ98_2806 [Pseudomonadota bacterium]|jgi:formamidopyrimidine-DNA glycosylase